MYKNLMEYLNHLPTQINTDQYYFSVLENQYLIENYKNVFIIIQKHKSY